MSWWINICDTPFEGNYKLAITKGLFTMLLIFIFGFCMGRLSSPNPTPNNGSFASAKVVQAKTTEEKE